jgi:hypothetical protein
VVPLCLSTLIRKFGLAAAAQLQQVNSQPTQLMERFNSLLGSSGRHVSIELSGLVANFFATALIFQQAKHKALAYWWVLLSLLWFGAYCLGWFGD